MSPRLSVRVVPFLLAIVCCVAPLAAQVKLAVVNVNKIFDGFEQRKAKETELKVEIEKIRTEMASLQVNLKELQQQAQSLNPGSPERAPVDQKIYETRADIELFDYLARIELEERMTDMTRDLYNSIREAVNGYASQNGFTLVLKYEGGDVVTTDRNDLTLEISARQVLYVKPQLDITDQILLILNKSK